MSPKQKAYTEIQKGDLKQCHEIHKKVLKHNFICNMKCLWTWNKKNIVKAQDCMEWSKDKDGYFHINLFQHLIQRSLY